jgi:two-component system chemotaxis response regulator CheB
MTSPPHTPDLVVIGASAGGVMAIQRIVSALPRSLPAAVLIVLHVHADSKSMLGTVLGRSMRRPHARAAGTRPGEART